jgi:hypothetical protein
MSRRVGLKGQPRCSKRRRNGLRRAALRAVLALFCSAGVCRAAPQVEYANQDTEIWYDDVVHVSWHDKQALLIALGLRQSLDIGHLIYRHAGAGYSFQPTGFLTIVPRYDFYNRNKSPVLKQDENRISLEITAAKDFGKWTLRDRNFCDRRFQPSGQTWRYRNRAEAEHCLPIPHLRLKGVLWYQAYYNTHDHGWAQKRVAAGVRRPLCKQISVQVYYLRQFDGPSRPGNVNAIGIRFDMSIGAKGDAGAHSKGVL